jgi:hypothetical protein
MLRPAAPTLPAQSRDDPFVHGLCSGVELSSGGGLAKPASSDRPHHLLSTVRGQAGIPVGVHSVLRNSLTFGDISVPGQDRMDYLLKVHI